MTVEINRGKVLGRLNLTPLIDCVFLLLIFFLVATRFAEEEREMDVMLPEASEARPLTIAPKELFININKEGQYYVTGKLLSLPELQQLLKTAWVDNQHQTVVIRADKRCIWEHVVAAMNACNKAHIHDYRVTTRDG
ncbi:MAG: biopolymer transporter ExbD [Pirellulales bacterium]|nr:biopolymer transporter ExbD [Pirellulales bacterium]